MSDEFGSIAQCATWCSDISTKDSLPIRRWLSERKDEIMFWSRAYESGVTVPRGGIEEKINNIGRGPREPCGSVPRSAPSPLFYLRHFFARCLTLIPRSLLLNLTDALATQAMADRESSIALCHGVALKKGIGRGPRERCRSVPRGGVKKKDRSRTREQYRSVPRGSVKEEKKMIIVDRERGVSLFLDSA